VYSEYGLGATYLGGGLKGFLVWAPLINQVEVHILSPEERIVPLEKVSRGYHYGVVQGVKPGTRYFIVSMGTLTPPQNPYKLGGGRYGKTGLGDDRSRTFLSENRES